LTDQLIIQRGDVVVDGLFAINLSDKKIVNK